MKKKRWTDEEIEIIKNNYNKTYDELQTLLPNRTIKSIKHKIKNMNLPREWAFKTYSKEEDEILRNNNMESQEKLLSLLPDRDWNSIIHRMLHLGLDREKAWRFWTKEEEDVLLSAKNLEEAKTKLPSRTEEQIYQKARKLNVLKSDKWWTEEQLITLKTLYPNNKCEDVAKILGRNIVSVYDKASELGIRNLLKSPNLDKEQIIKLYCDDKIEIKQIAKMYNVSSRFISKIIPLELKRNYRSINNSEVVERYLNGESCASISVDYKVSSTTIRRVLSENNIEIRDVAEYFLVKLPMKEVIDLYNFGFSAQNIGEFYNVTGTTIIKRLRENNIEIRDSSFYIYGEKAPNWKGGITSLNIRARNSKEYLNWRKQVLERDKYTCQCCNDNYGGNLQVHHILNFSDNEHLRTEINNGITLCEDCHHPNNKGSFHNLYGTYNNDIFQLQDYFDDIRTELNLPLIDIEKDILYKDID